MSDGKSAVGDIPQTTSAVQEQTRKVRGDVIARVAITSLSLLYVAAVAVNWLPGRIATPELLLLTVLIVWNSGLLNGLAEFAISKDGLSFKRQIAQQAQTIDSHQASLTTQAQSLATQAESLAALQRKQQETLRFVLQYLLTTSEREKLSSLRDAKEHSHGFGFDHRPEVVWEMRRLGGLDFVTNVAGSGIDKLQQLPDGVHADMTHFFTITEAGIEYLNRRKELGLS